MVKIIGKKDEKKGFSVDSLIELANGVKLKIKDLIALHNAKEDEHEVDDNVEIDLGNGKTAKLADLVKLANKDTNDGEESDEEKNKKKAEEEDRDKSIKNCGCNGKEDGEHKEDCKMYNSAKAVEFRNNKRIELANEKIKALEEENAAIKAAAGNFSSFVQISNARNKEVNEDKVLLENGTLNSGSMEAGLERGKKLFAK